MNSTHLQQRPSGRIYLYSPILAARNDMIPVDLDGDGKTTVQAAVKVPPAVQPGMNSALARLDGLESQLRDVISVITKMPGGAELLAQRETDVSVDLPSDKPQQVPTPPSAAPPPPTPTPTPAPVAPTQAPPPVDEANGIDPVVKAVHDEVAAAEKKLASAQKYLADRTSIEAEASRAYETLLADREKGTEVPDAELEAAGTALKGARIKLKSANTKLGTAQRQLNDAQTELSALTTPAA